MYDPNNKSAVLSLNNDIKILISLTKKDFLSGDTMRDGKDTKSLFLKVNNLLGVNKNKRQFNFLDMSQSETYLGIMSFFESLANMHEPWTLNDDLRFEGEILFTSWIDSTSVLKSLLCLDIKGPSAPFDVPPFIYREYAIFLCEPVRHLINMSCSYGICPEIWKASFLIPIPKIINPKGPNHIRPISITSPLAKICERVILNVTLDSISSKLDPNQFGGIPGRSTSQYLAIFMDRIAKNMDRGENGICTIITDYEKAYDNVDHNVFYEKFKLLDPPYISMIWLSSFLFKRSQFFGGSNGNIDINFKSSNGIPQGTVMGSFIFSIMVNDICINEKGILKYVDDITISCKVNEFSAFLPQLTFNKFSSESKEARLPLNILKCFFINFDSRKVKIPVDIISEGIKLQSKSSFSLLGVTIQNNLKWDSHVHEIIVKANKRMFLLYSMKRFNMNKFTIKLVYISFIRSVLEYGSPIWHPSLTKNLSNDLEKVQKRAIRIIMGKDYMNYTHALVFLNMDSLENRRISLHRKFALDFFGKFPHFFPASQFEISGRLTRGCNQIRLPYCNTNRFKNSPIVSFIEIINENIEEI